MVVHPMRNTSCKDGPHDFKEWNPYWGLHAAAQAPGPRLNCSHVFFHTSVCSASFQIFSSAQSIVQTMYHKTLSANSFAVFSSKLRAALISNLSWKGRIYRRWHIGIEHNAQLRTLYLVNWRGTSSNCWINHFFADLCGTFCKTNSSWPGCYHP